MVSEFVTKPLFLMRLRDIVNRLKGIKVPSECDVEALGFIESELDSLEAKVAHVIDDYMAAKIDKVNRPAPNLDTNGLSGQWQMFQRRGERR